MTHDPDRPNRVVRACLAALTALALVPLAALGSANHTQVDSGKSIVFDHKAGNEWWVEVMIGGGSASSVTKVEAQQDRAGAWQTLTKRSWGAWAASYHIPSDEVRFRATFTDGIQTVSCWFTHPAGVERCGIAMPTGAWTVQAVGSAGTVGIGGSAAVDLNGDGRDEIYVLGADGLVQHRKEGSAWAATKILGPSGSVGWTEALALTVGDADDDGRTDVYSAVRTFVGTQSTTRIYVSSWTGTGWVHEEISNMGAFVDGMSVGDVDGDGRNELWITAGLAVGRVDRTSSFWVTEHAASFPEAVFGIAVGDADRDGDAEAWATSGLDDHASLWRIEATANGYAGEQVAFSTARGARDIAVGDGDNDGQVEAYVMNSAHADVIQVLRFSYSGGVWTERRIDLGPGRPLGLDLADADGDGKREIYVSDWDGRLLQASWTGSSWAGAAVAQLGNGDFLQQVAIGDPETDGKPSAYGFGVDPAAQPGTCCNPVTMYRLARVAAGAFDATFTGVRGNEWWVQANVAGNQAIAKVDVSINAGAWKPLAKQSWGANAWAASYHLPQGTVVQLRATSTTGATDLSECYRWIPPSNADATTVTCGTTPPPPTGFDATFSGVKGNEWWVQVNVAGNQPVAKVDARVNCGTWVALTLQDWGGWARSFHVPSGSKVDFRATSSTGATDVSGGYVWPQATPTAACA